MGLLIVIPGAHFRQIDGLDIARCPRTSRARRSLLASPVSVALHHGLWHCGSRNSTDAVRYMVKIRLDPATRAGATLGHL